jgi:hypothetical protein
MLKWVKENSSLSDHNAVCVYDLGVRIYAYAKYVNNFFSPDDGLI